MKKRVFSLFLALVMAVSLVPAALAAEANYVTPTPPSWVPENEYAIFPGSAAYLPENWEVIQNLRREVSWGAINLRALPKDVSSGYSRLYKLATDNDNPDAGVLFELALVETRLLYSTTKGTGPYWSYLMHHIDEIRDDLLASQWYPTLLWNARSVLRYRGLGEEFNESVAPLLSVPGFSMDILLNSVIFTEEEKAMYRSADLSAAAQIEVPVSGIRVFLDGKHIKMDVLPEVRNQRTMVPIRAVVEALGGSVEWNQEKQEIVMTRAGSTVVMILNNTTATVDGLPVEMDVAPYAIDGRTLIPARYVAEFFGQNVEWDGASQAVLITETKNVAGNSNLEAWALPMGAILANNHYMGRPAIFGTTHRNAWYAWRSRDVMDGSWNIHSREDLINTVLSMSYYGHNATFKSMVEDMKGRTQAERETISAASDAWPSYMWEYTEYVDEKWGDRGIMAWDLFRMSDLVQWGYVAGYVTYEEALALLEPAATRLCENFSSWDEAYENYLDGYNWWDRNDVLNKDIWETSRGKSYLEMKEDPSTKFLFDDALFETGVIGLPEAE